MMWKWKWKWNWNWEGRRCLERKRKGKRDFNGYQIKRVMSIDLPLCLFRCSCCCTKGHYITAFLQAYRHQLDTTLGLSTFTKRPMPFFLFLFFIFIPLSTKLKTKLKKFTSVTNTTFFVHLWWF